MRVKRAVISVLLAAVLFVMPVSALSESVDFGSIDTPVATHLSSTADGWLDSVSITEIRGWAWNSATPNSPIDVHVYVINTTLNREWSYAVTADQYRADLDVAGYGNGYHGFSYLINWYNYPAGDYLIRVYGMDGVTNPQLSGCPGTFSIASPTGSGDYLGSDGIRGWAWKPISPDFPIQVHIYVRNMSGQVLNNIVLTADEYRADLQAAGYGNGNHGFSTSINWSDYPEEKLRVTVYAVDGTGYHPAIFNGEYDNRLPIRVLYTIDQDGINLGSWCVTTLKQDFEKIGCSKLYKYKAINPEKVIRAIDNSSFCILSTHGDVDGIQCMENGVATWLSSQTIENLSAGYFNGTRCVLLDSCLTGSGGSSNPKNLVNTLYRKGIETVIGFKQEIYFEIVNGDKVSYQKGDGLWCTVFVTSLGNGKNIKNAISDAIGALHQDNPEDLYGMDSVYVAGNIYQIVKH